jgi:aspartate/methionine/tyrosine aminotransferase
MSYSYKKPEGLHRFGLENYRDTYGFSVAEMDKAVADLPRTPDQIDLTHGDTRAFLPPASALENFTKAVMDNSEAYSVYRGSATVRNLLAPRVSRLLGIDVDPTKNLIITPGTQGALFGALSAFVAPGTVVAFPALEYFMNEKIVSYLGGESIRVPALTTPDGYIEIQEADLEHAHKSGATVFVFSNPNNPTGGIYSQAMIEKMAKWAKKYEISVIVDQLYCRLIYDGRTYTHFASLSGMSEQCITLMGPSKTESMSGYRVGIAVGPASIINSMETILSMTALRTAGYSQHALTGWLDEEPGWLEERTVLHQEIRDYLMNGLESIAGIDVRMPGGSSYIFPSLINTKSVNDNDYANDFLFAKDLKSAGVLISPGYQSGLSGKGHFRINFSQHFDLIKKTVDTIDSLIQK